MRDPVANKTHYPNGSTLLDKSFETIFTHDKGPGALPTLLGEKKTKAIIVPHAPYTLAGPAMAWGYKALAEGTTNNKLFIIIAQAQHSTESGVTAETFTTPYGEVRTDQHLVRELVNKGNISYNEGLHQKESLIEIQLPFLQFIYKKHYEQIKIVPLFVNPDTNISALSIDIKETLLEQNKEATFIFVSNMTSYGREFKYVPYTENIPENITKNDTKVLQAIKNYDKKLFNTILEDTLIPVSSRSALDLYFHYFTNPKVYLESYYLSGDINKDYKTTVSYATLVVK